MAEVRYWVCDKCGERIKTGGLFRRKVTVLKARLPLTKSDPCEEWLMQAISAGLPRRTLYTRYCGGRDYVLCKVCEKALREFFNTPPAGNGGAGNET